MKSYVPSPLDTSDVTLPKELDELSELLSRHVHEVWCKSRINNGWSYGVSRNDELKETPCIVPYDDLSEEEKGYDRITTQETLKLIIKLGFEISKNQL